MFFLRFVASLVDFLKHIIAQCFVLKVRLTFLPNWNGTGRAHDCK